MTARPIRPRIMPCLLLQNGALVKTINFQNPTYVGDPANAVRIFNELEVDELVFLDINASTQKSRPNFKLLSEISSECFMPVAYGGGIKSIDDVKTIFSLGFEKVIINSAAFEQPELITAISDKFGAQSIVVSIDAKKISKDTYSVFTHNAKFDRKISPLTHAKNAERLGAGEVLLCSIDMEGTHKGYDLKLIQSISSEISIPLVACGGANTVSDFRDSVKQGGASACAAGSMFVHYGPHRAVLINFPESRELNNIFGL